LVVGVSLPRGCAGLSQGWLGGYCVTLGTHLFGLLNVSLAGLEPVEVTAVAAHQFSQFNGAWISFLQARSSGCWSFDSPWCFISTKCGSSFSARFWSHRAHSVWFHTLVTILDLSGQYLFNFRNSYSKMSIMVRLPQEALHCNTHVNNWLSYSFMNRKTWSGHLKYFPLSYYSLNSHLFHSPLFLLFFSFFYLFFETGFHCVSQYGLKLFILQPHPPVC
jgi:hypothetical protein